MKRLFLLTALCWMTAAVAFGSPVKIKAGNTDVTVEFYTPSIVRVVKSPVGHAYTKQGLVVIANPEAVKVSQKGNTVSSDQLTVKVDPQTGAVTFISKGKTLLREKGTATFDPRTEGPDKGAYRVTQTFLLDKEGYLNEGKPLGDHYPVAATFKVVSRDTGIDDVRIDQAEGSRVYDLNGQRVNRPKNGIYIEQQGGKAGKRVIK